MKNKFMNNQKGFAPIIIALIVAVVLGGGYVIIKAQSNKKVEDKTSAPTIPAQDTFTTSGTVAVFFNPSQEWIDQAKKEDEQGFYTSADDFANYLVKAQDFLKTKNMKTVSTDKRYLDFIKDNGQHVLIDRNSNNNQTWGIFLFDGKQYPFNADMTVIKSEYEKYFK